MRGIGERGKGTPARHHGQTSEHVREIVQGSPIASFDSQRLCFL